jgi:hypothetical protein
VEPSPAERAIATSNGKWADALRDLLAADADYAARAVSAANSSALDPYASRIARGEDLKPEGRARLRLVLLDAIAAQSNPKVKVDGKLGDVDMNALKQRYGATSTTDMEVQSEIILRWMASLDR